MPSPSAFRFVPVSIASFCSPFDSTAVFAAVSPPAVWISVIDFCHFAAWSIDTAATPSSGTVSALVSFDPAAAITSVDDFVPVAAFSCARSRLACAAANFPVDAVPLVAATS